MKLIQILLINWHYIICFLNFIAYSNLTYRHNLRCGYYLGLALRRHVFGHIRTAKAQISLRIRAGWSGPSLSANRIIGYYRIYEWWAWPGWYDAHAQDNLNLRILRISKALFCMTRPIFIIFLDFYYISYKTWEITGACFNSHSARLKVSKLTQKIVITSYNHIHQIRWGFLVGKPTVSQMRTPHILPIQLMPAVLSEDPILL